MPINMLMYEQVDVALMWLVRHFIVVLMACLPARENMVNAYVVF